MSIFDLLWDAIKPQKKGKKRIWSESEKIKKRARKYKIEEKTKDAFIRIKSKRRGPRKRD